MSNLTKLQDFVKEELRSRFDAAVNDPLKSIDIIEQAMGFGFAELANGMVNDFCVDDDMAHFWKLRKREIQNEEAEGQEPFEKQIESLIATGGVEL